MIGWSFWTHWCKLELEVLKIAEVMCLIENGRRFYVPEAREGYHPQFSELV